MYHDKQGMVGKSAQKIRGPYYDPPGLIGQHPGHTYLEKYQPDYCKNCQGIFSNQLPDMRMLS